MFSFFLDFHGFVQDVSTVVNSANGKPFYDVFVKIAPKDQITVRIMKKSNPSVQRQTFLDALQSGRPISLKNLNKGQRDCYFFNSFRGSLVENCQVMLDFKASDLSSTNVKELLEKTELGGTYLIVGYIKWLADIKQNVSGRNIRQAIFQDKTGKIPITLWEKRITEVEENNCYQMTNICLKSYFGKTLQTMPQTRITEIIPSEFDVTWDDNDTEVFLNREKEGKASMFTTFSCPEICCADILIYPICLSCNKKVTAIPSEILLTCSSCSKTMLASKCICGITINHNGKSQNITVLKEILEKFFEEDVIQKYKDETKPLMVKILNMTNVDITVNTKKRCD